MKSITLKPKVEELNRLNDFIQKEFNLDNLSLNALSFTTTIIADCLFIPLAEYVAAEVIS